MLKVKGAKAASWKPIGMKTELVQRFHQTAVILQSQAFEACPVPAGGGAAGKARLAEGGRIVR